MTDTTTTAAADTAATTDTAAVANTNSTAAIVPPAGQGQGEAATTADTTTEAKVEGEGKAVHEGAPEAYADFTLPEHLVLSEERTAFTTTLFKDLDLSQSQAQKLLDAMVKLRGETEGELQGDIDAKVEAKRDALREEWLAQTKAEFAGKFDDLAKDAVAGRTWAEQHRPNILKTFDDEGWGNNADALWVFAKLGELTRGSSMDGLGGETAGSETPKTAAQILYPNEVKK